MIFFELLSATAFPDFSSDLVAKVLTLKSPLSRELNFDLPGSTLSLASSALNACGEVTGLHAILASFRINLQNSAKGGYPALACFPSILGVWLSSSNSSTAIHSSTTLLHLTTRWFGSF